MAIVKIFQCDDMKNKIKSICKTLVMYVKEVIIRIFAIRHFPSSLIEPNSKNVIFRYLEIEGLSFSVAEVLKARVFTNRNDNISVTAMGRLIPLVSWQYSEGKVLPDSQNRFLLKKIGPIKPPYKVSGSVVSLLTGGGGNYNYYHWLFDSLPRIELITRAGIDLRNCRYFIPERTYRFQIETLNLLGISQDKIVSSKMHNFIETDRCIATTHPNPNSRTIPSWILKFLRDSFMDKSSESNFSRFIYIERSDNTNSRKLLNEADLYEVLRPIGFKAYRLSGLSVEDQIRLFSKAKIIVGVHGAGFANLAFASCGATVFELFSNSYSPMMYKSISNKLGLLYNGVLSENYERKVPPSKANFKLSRMDIRLIAEKAEQIAAGDGHSHT